MTRYQIESFEKKEEKVQVYFKDKRGIVMPYDQQKYTKQTPMIEDGKFVGLLRE